MIRVSIITPTYNRVNKLRLNIKSVLDQQFKDIEHIIVDNLSDDGSEELVKAYIKRADYPVRYIREKDSGLYQAMNKGIKEAEGEWIHILNSDDGYFFSSSLKDIFNLNIAHVDLVACGVMVARDHKQTYCRPEYKKEINHYYFPHQGLLIRKKLYELNGYYEERFKIISDAIFAIKNFPKAKYLIIDKPLVVMSSGGLSDEKSFTNLYERILCITFYHKFPILHKIRLILGIIIGYLIVDKDQED